MIDSKMYELVNGHSNWYWRWGLEDHDMAHRISTVFQNNNVENPVEKLGTDSVRKGFSSDGTFPGLLRQVEYGFYSTGSHKHGYIKCFVNKLELFSKKFFVFFTHFYIFS